MSSKVTTGIDHTNSWDKFYVDAGGLGFGCSPRNLLQMMGRFRELTNTNVQVLVAPADDKRPCSTEKAYQTLFNAMKTKRELMQTKYRGWLRYDAEFKEEDLVLSPDQMSKLFANVSAEQHVQFVQDLTRQAKAKGYSVVNNIHQTTESDIGSKAQKKVEEIEKELRNRTQEQIDMQQLKMIINTCERLISEQKGTKEIRTQLDIASKLQYQPHEKLSYEELEFVEKNLFKIMNLAAVSRASKKVLLRYDLNRILKKQQPDLTTTPLFFIYALIHEAVTLLGFSSVMDSDTKIEDKVVTENKDRLISLCEQSIILRSGKSRIKVISRDSHTAKVVLRRELRAIYGIKFITKRTGKFKDKVLYELVVPPELLELALTSSFFNNNSIPPIARKAKISKSSLDIVKSAYSKPDESINACQNKTAPSESVQYHVVGGIQYVKRDFGGEGNCLFLAVAGALKEVCSTSGFTHKSLRKAVSEWQIEFGPSYQIWLGATPADVILDNPDQPPHPIFSTWTWSMWGEHIGRDGVWGGSSEIPALNAVIPSGWKVRFCLPKCPPPTPIHCT